MKPFYKFVAVVSAVPLLVGIIFFDNIKGYYRFKQFCEKDGGLRVYEPIKKNIGLLAKDKYEAYTAALLNNVLFVRYEDHDGYFYDVKYLGGNPNDDSSFSVSPANLDISLKYQWKVINTEISNEVRLGNSGYEIFDTMKNMPAARYNIFYYSKFDRSKTILDAPSDIGCFNYYSSDYRKKSPVLKQIESAFID